MARQWVSVAILCCCGPRSLWEKGWGAGSALACGTNVSCGWVWLWVGAVWDCVDVVLCVDVCLEQMCVCVCACVCGFFGGWGRARGF